MKIGESCPESLYICGKSFSANPGVGVRIAKGSIFGESGDKRVGIAAIPGFMIAAGDFGGFHCWSSRRKVFGFYLNSFFSV